MIYIPKIPNNVVAITTNSSSEIFVIGKDQKINQVEQIIDEGGWRWWFGEKKRLNNKKEIQNFVKSYQRVLKDLFPSIESPPKRHYYEWDHDAPEQIRAIQAEIKKLQSMFHESTDPAERDKLSKQIGEKYELQDSLSEALFTDWLVRQDFSFLNGMYYYKCHEDNELSDWDTVHSTVPGRYARMG